jgi:hypothetical protein
MFTASVTLADIGMKLRELKVLEPINKGDKHGLDMNKRSKKCFEAQQMVMLLGSLSHNFVVWAQRWLSPPTSASHL